MEHAPDASSRLARMSTVPLVVAYAAIPLGAGLLSILESPHGPAPFLPWLTLAGLGCVFAMLFRRSRVPVKKRFMFEVLLFVLLVWVLVLYGGDAVQRLEPGLPYVRECVPLVMLLFCGLWALTFGLPDRADLQRYGALLGSLCLVDLVAEGIVYQAVPTVRWIGNADVLAGLLLVSLCAGLRPGGNDGGLSEPDQGRRIWRGLTMIGLLACLSRTGLFGAAWVILCFGRGGRAFRIGYSLLCLAFIVMSFFLPATLSNSIRYIDYWLWVEAIRLFSGNVDLLFTGFPVALALPVEIPFDISPLWETATGMPSMMGAYLTQVPSFWLRLVLAWGLVVPLVVLLVVFILLLRRLTRMGAGLTAALFAQGMTTPLLFEPALAVAIGLGYGVALAASGPRPNVRKRQQDAEDPDVNRTNAQRVGHAPTVEVLCQYSRINPESW